MEKKCIKCNKPIPDEAAFCLFCFTEQEAGLSTAPLVYGTAAPTKKIGKKVIAGIVLCAFVFLFLLGGCIAAMKKSNSSSQLATETPMTETQVVTYTQTVDVTDASGEQVTNSSGEAVTNVITVTQIHTYVPVQTTEEQGFFDKLFNDNKETTADNTSAGDKNPQTTTETTEKQGFFDKLFGNDTTATTKAPPSFADVVTTQKADSSSTTKNNTSSVQPGTTQKPSTTQTPTTHRPTTTQKPSTTQAPATQPTTEQGSYYFEYKAYSSQYPDGHITLTKYVGNASVVTIPFKIDNRIVVGVSTDCFKDDSRIREIRVEYNRSRPYFIVSTHAFNNLSNLTKIDCTENGSFHPSPQFAVNCPITEMIYSGHERTFIDGAYYYNGTALLWFTSHPDYTTLTLPAQCTKIDNGHNLAEVPNLKVLNIHKNVSNIPFLYIHYNDGLEQVNVEAGNPWALSVNGVMFCKNVSNKPFDYCIYPRQNKTKTLVMPRVEQTCKLGYSRSSLNIANDNLEELWMNKTSLLTSPDSKAMYTTAYPNLKRIYITPNHPQYDLIAKTFTGELIVKDF